MVIVDANHKSELLLGYQGESERTCVQFNLEAIAEEYPGGVVTLLVKRPGDTNPYPVLLVQDGDIYSWYIGVADTSFDGDGECQLTYQVGTVIVKTHKWPTHILESMTGATVDPPDPWESFVEDVLAAADEVMEAVRTVPETINAALEAAKESGEFDGYSPTVRTETITGGHRVIVTDAEGEHKFNVMDGTKGDTGTGIASIVLNPDYTLTINMTDGSHYTTESIRGETGKGISSVTLNQDYTLTITYTDGTNTTTASIRGATGATPDISIGTVETLPAGSAATASMTGTPEHPVLNLGIPEGEQGVPGEVSANDIAPGYDSLTYPVKKGTHCYHSGTLYEARQDIATTEAWTAEHWKVVNIADGVEKVREIADMKFGFKSEHEKTYFDRDTIGEYSDSICSSTRRWFFDEVVPAGTLIKELRWKDKCSVTTRYVYVEIWAKSGDSLTRVKQVAVNIKESTAQSIAKVYSAELNYLAESDCMVSYVVSSNAVIYKNLNNTENTMLTSKDVSTETTALLYSSLTTWYMDVSATLYCEVASRVNVITIGPGMDYEEIQDALLTISDDSASNRYVLWVMPKTTPYKPFTMLRASFDDAYPWNSISPRYISIIGFDRKGCVIRSDSGFYKKPCGEPMTNGVIRNLTFIMTNDEQDANADKGGYCLHIDCRTAEDVGYDMLIEDCDFESASGPCLGIGLHKNCTLTIRRCNMKTTLDSNYAPHEGYMNLYNYGCLFCHTSTRADAEAQRLVIDNCYGDCISGNKSCWITTAGSYDPETNYFTYLLLRNVFWNFGLAAPGYKLNSSLVLDPQSFGNNIQEGTRGGGDKEWSQ